MQGGGLPDSVLPCTITALCFPSRDMFTFRLSDIGSVLPWTETTTKFRLFAWYGWLNGSPCPSCTVLYNYWPFLNSTGLTVIEYQYLRGSPTPSPSFLARLKARARSSMSCTDDE